MEEKIRRSIIFEGRVQGVGFRYRAHHAAQQFGLTGWVRNSYDGTVVMEVQGHKELIDRMLLCLEYGRYVRIDHMDVKKLPVKEEEKGFRILE